MLTILVSLDINGKPVAMASPPLLPGLTPNQLIINNQTGSELFMAQMLFHAVWIGGPSPAPPPNYRNVLRIAPGSVQIEYYPAIKAYVGFALNNGSVPPVGEAVMAGVPTDDSWFLSPPTLRHVVPIRFSSSIDVVLSPQADPNPPHNVHPVTGVSVNWDTRNPMLCATNRSGGRVIMYFRVFHKDGTPPTDSALPLVTPVSYYQLPTGNFTFQKAWYGFAFADRYADAAAYFAAHPQGQDHHTKEIPPTDADAGTTDAASA